MKASWKFPLAALTLNTVLITSILAYRITGAAQVLPPAAPEPASAPDRKAIDSLTPAEVPVSVQPAAPMPRLSSQPKGVASGEAAGSVDAPVIEKPSVGVLPEVPSLQTPMPNEIFRQGSQVQVDPQIAAMVAGELQKYAAQEGLTIHGNPETPAAPVKSETELPISPEEMHARYARAAAIIAISESIQKMSGEIDSIYIEESTADRLRIAAAIEESFEIIRKLSAPKK